MSRFIQPDDEITRAAQWLADKPRWADGLRRELQERFGLDQHEVADAVERARKMQILRRANA